MPDPPAPLYLDEDVSVLVATILQARGLDAVTTRDVGKLGRTDAEQLATRIGYPWGVRVPCGCSALATGASNEI
jgi:hypothetical protein